MFTNTEYNLDLVGLKSIRWFQLGDSKQWNRELLLETKIKHSA